MRRRGDRDRAWGLRSDGVRRCAGRRRAQGVTAEGADRSRVLHAAAAPARSRAGQAHLERAVQGDPRRAGVEDPLPLARARRFRHRGLGRRGRAHRRGARRRSPGDQLGARHPRHRRPVRTVAHRRHGVAPAVDREGRVAGLRRGRHRLRGSRHARHAPLPRRRERGPRRARHREGRAADPRDRRRRQDLRVGPVAGRTGGALRRRDPAELRTRARPARRGVGRTGHRRDHDVPGRRHHPRDARVRGHGAHGHRSGVPRRQGRRRAHSRRARARPRSSTRSATAPCSTRSSSPPTR